MLLVSRAVPCGSPRCRTTEQVDWRQTTGTNPKVDEIVRGNVRVTSAK